MNGSTSPTLLDRLRRRIRPSASAGLGWPSSSASGESLGWPGVSRETTSPAEAADVESAEVDAPEPSPRHESVASDDDDADEVDSDAAAPRRARLDAAMEPRVAMEPDPEIRPQLESTPAQEPSAEQVEDLTPAAVSRETALTDSLPEPAAPRVFVVANQKGGVGKTTTTVNVAVGLARGGLDVLVIDLDPQGNASTALGIDHREGTPGTYEVLMEGKSIADLAVESPESGRLVVLPATTDLAGAEVELVSVVARENRLKRAIKAYLAENDVDYVFLDCPPSLGLLTLNALVAASEILIPIQCEYYALEGVSQLMRTIDIVKGELNDDLELSTVLLTMYDARTRLAAQVADEVRTHFAEQTLPVVIPRSVRISEAPSYGQSVITYQPDSAGARSYLDAARQIAVRGAADLTGDDQR